MNKPFLFFFVFLALAVSLVSASYGQNAYGAGYYGSEPVSYAGGTPGGGPPATTVNETTNVTAPPSEEPTTAGEEATGGTGGETGGATAGEAEQPTVQEEEQPPAGNIAEQVSQLATKSPAITIVVVAVIILGILWLVRSKLGL